MAGSLIKIQSVTTSSSVASVTLTGISSAYNVYIVEFDSVTPDVDDTLFARVTESGTPNTTANYSTASKQYNSSAGTTSAGASAGGETSFNLSFGLESTVTNNCNGILYLYNFNSSSSFSYVASDLVGWGSSSNEMKGRKGGHTFESASTCDGIQFFLENSNNIVSGATFTLYGLKKS